MYSDERIRYQQNGNEKLFSNFFIEIRYITTRDQYSFQHVSEEKKMIIDGRQVCMESHITHKRTLYQSSQPTRTTYL